MVAISFAGWLGNMAAILSSIDMLVVDVVVDVLVVARVVLVLVVEGAVVVKGVVVVTVFCVVDVDGAKGVGLSI